MERGTKTEKVVNTKISYDAFQRLQKVTSKANISIYNFLQIVIDCFYRCFCGNEPVTEEMREILDKFINLERSRNGFSLIAPYLRDIEFSKFLAILSKKNKGVPEIVLIQKEGDSVSQNLNRDEILSAFLLSFSPRLLRDLRSIQQTEKLTYLTDALNLAIRPASVLPEDIIHNEIMELFEDANNIVIVNNEGGRNGDNITSGSLGEIGRYKRKHNKSFSGYESEETKRRESPDPLDYADSLQEIEESFSETEY